MKNNIRAFIVEDSLFLREVLCRVFSQAGIEVAGLASSVEEALFQIEQLRPDVVLVDIVLPGKNGIVLINKISQLYSEIKIIICSSVPRKHILTQSEQIGNVAFISKPFGYDEIVEAVFSVVNKHREEQQERARVA